MKISIIDLLLGITGYVVLYWGYAELHGVNIPFHALWLPSEREKVVKAWKAAPVSYTYAGGGATDTGYTPTSSATFV